MVRLALTHKTVPEIGILFDGRQVSSSRIPFFAENYALPFTLVNQDISTKIEILGAYLPEKGKIKKKELKEESAEILEYCAVTGIDMLIVCQADYFAHLTGVKGFEKNIGHVFTCTIPDYEHITIVPVLNRMVVYRLPDKRKLLERGLNVVSKLLAGEEVPDTLFEMKSYKMVTTVEETKQMLTNIWKLDKVSFDIETTSLSPIKGEFITMAFGTSASDAFTLVVHPKYTSEYKQILAMLTKFFKAYKGKLLIHNIMFEGSWLARKMFMSHIKDQQAVIDMLNQINYVDTQHLAYCVYNSTDRISVGLKDLAFSEFGDWDSDIDVKNAINEPLDKLAKYNAVDCCATYWLYEKLMSEVTDSQLSFYENVMRPQANLMLKASLHGLKVNLFKSEEAAEELRDIISKATEALRGSTFVAKTEAILKKKAYDKWVMGLKNPPSKTLEEYKDTSFNPGSPVQLRVLLYDVMMFDPIEFTDTGLSSTNRDSMVEFLMESKGNTTKVETLEALIEISQAGIVLNTFIAQFLEGSVDVGDGEMRMFGNFKIGGTQSFRMTASKGDHAVNFLNMPANSHFGKMIKGLFDAPKGWLVGGFDYASLQGRTGGILADDPALIRLYNENIDLHSYMCTRYWRDEFPDFEDTAAYYKLVKTKYEDIRQKSKSLTFLMQFGGGVAKLHKELGGTREEAEHVYNTYHDTFGGISIYNEESIRFAEQNGYVELGLGLRLHTPKIRSADREVAATEGRSLANAKVQFWDCLTLLGMERTQKRIEDDGYADRIFLTNSIYDSVYFVFPDDAEVIKYLNDTLIEEMTKDFVPKQKIPLIGNLDIGTNWANMVELPNNASLSDIAKIRATIGEDK